MKMKNIYSICIHILDSIVILLIFLFDPDFRNGMYEIISYKVLRLKKSEDYKKKRIEMISNKKKANS